MVTNQIKCEVWKNNYSIVYARKGEINARTIVASFKDVDGSEIDLTGKTVTFYALKPDGTQIYNNCTVDAVNGTATTVLTSQAVSVAGIVNCEYQIFEGNEFLLKAGGLKLVVEDDCDFSEAIESTSECNALIKAINEAETFSEGIGSLSNLTTTDKETLVGAINEVNGQIIPISRGGTSGETLTEARTNLGVMTGVELYYNASGKHGTITLSDSISNYAAIKVLAFNSDNLNISITIWNNGGNGCETAVTSTSPYIQNSENRMTLLSSRIAISDTSITFSTETFATMRPSGTQLTVGNAASASYTKIYKIIGYKY